MVTVFNSVDEHILDIAVDDVCICGVAVAAVGIERQRAVEPPDRDARAAFDLAGQIIACRAHTDDPARRGCSRRTISAEFVIGQDIAGRGPAFGNSIEVFDGGGHVVYNLNGENVFRDIAIAIDKHYWEYDLRAIRLGRVVIQRVDIGQRTQTGRFVEGKSGDDQSASIIGSDFLREGTGIDENAVDSEAADAVARDELDGRFGRLRS